MLDRVHISDVDKENVKIQLSDETGIVIDVSVVPQNEWNDLRNKIIESKNCPIDFTGSINYLAALWCFLEN